MKVEIGFVLLTNSVIGEDETTELLVVLLRAPAVRDVRVHNFISDIAECAYIKMYGT